MTQDRTRDETSERNGKYLYAVVPADKADTLNLDASGIEGARVYPVVSGKLAALVSDIGNETLRPQRKHLAAHSGVLRQAMEQAPLLPVAFGIVAGSEREVRELLRAQEDAFSEQLRALTGQVEMGLRGRVQVPNTAEYFVKAVPELRAMRDDIFSGGEPSREQKIELGKYFAEVLDHIREETIDAVQEAIGPVSSSVRVNEPRNESELLNLAVLVPRDRLQDFNRAVEDAASKLDENFHLEVSGPWPPYNFVDLRIHLEEPMVQVGQEGEEAQSEQVGQEAH